MNIKNIVFTAVAVCAFGNQITAKDKLQNSKQAVIISIEAELYALHKKIGAFKKELTLAQEQTEAEWNTLTACWEERKDKDKDLYFYQSYTVDCSSYEELFKGEFFHDWDIKKDGYNKANTPVRKAKSDYSDANIYYNRFQQTLERCNRHHDFTCLDELLEEIRAWNKNN